MPFDTFDNLCLELADYTARADLTAKWPDFIRLAEVKFARVLRTVEMEVSTTLTTASDGTVSLPVDFQEVRSLNTLGATGADLDFYPPDVLAVRNGAGWTGDVYGYSLSGTTLQIAPAGVGQVSLIYSAIFVPLSTDNETNWLLANHPDAYLYGALAEYGMFNDPGQVPAWTEAVQAVLSDIEEADRRKRWRSGRVVMSMCTP